MGQRVRRFLPFLYCLLFALSLLGCAAPLSLESLSALNRRAYAGGICGVPKGTPPNIHFYAVNIAMGKVVTDRNPEALRRFMPNADSVHEVRPWAPLSSAKTVPIALGVTCPARKELPTDLQTALNEIVGSSCKTAGNERPNSQYLGQTFQNAGSSKGLELKLVAAVLTWALQEASASEPRIPVPTTRQLRPLPPTEWEPLTPATEGEAPSTLEHPVVQFSGGAVAGGLIAPVPFGAMGADVAIELRLLPKGTYWARVGKASGEIVVGTGQMILAGAGMGAGIGMTGTGGGAPAGVLVVAGSYAIGVNGCITAGHGASDLKHLFREGDVPSGSSAPPPRKLLLKKVPKKAAPQAPVAEPAPTVKPAPAAKPAQPTTPQQTTTKTLYKSTGKTVTKTGETITTTTPRPKGKPSATGTPTGAVAEGAPGASAGAGKTASSVPKATAPYTRPTGATTSAQRASVQGKPCVDCGTVAPRQVADHKTPLVKEHYETGAIDKSRMRSNDAVQPQCPTCSARQGAEMSQYSREQRQLLKDKAP